ncbi:MAG: HD domain-containing protein [Planctomycetes bacterium]|nr:HD domain-containing protein [Planctomycetota bacterium]
MVQSRPPAVAEPSADVESLGEAARSLFAALDGGDVCATLAETALKLFGADAASVRLLEGDNLRLAASLNLGPEYTSHVLVGARDSNLGRAIEERRPIAVVDLLSKPGPLADIARALGLRAMLCTPLAGRIPALGGFNLYWLHPRVLTTRQLGLAGALASQAGLALEAAGTRRDLLNSFYVMARTLEASDAYTAGHSERVTQYAVILGRALKLTGKQVQWLETMGPLHDIGKVAVPKSVLHKPGRLDAMERKIIEKHVTMGVEILEPIRSLAAGMTIVRHHHEWWNGKGYPDGLAGETIPLLGRVTAVADAFDAMTSDRPYRKALPAEVAVREFEKWSGIQHDPALVPVWTRIVRNGEFGIRMVQATARKA